MKKIVFTFGRFNPPTTGHHLLANKVKDIANKKSAEYKIFGSSSQDAKRNPLSPTDKFRFMKKILKGFNVDVDRNNKTPFQVLQQLSDQGYEDVTMVVGADRVSEFKKNMSRYIGKKGYENISNFNVVSAGERDPDAEGVTGMSASKMRAAAEEGNFSAFRVGMPRHVSERDAKGLFNAIRKGMGVRGKIQESSWFDFDEYEEFYEQVQLDEGLLGRPISRDTHKVNSEKEKALARGKSKEEVDAARKRDEYSRLDEQELNELTVQARRKLARRMKRTAKKRARVRKRKEKFRKTKTQLSAKAKKQAVMKVRQKLIRGMNWTDLPYLQREKIDAKVKKKKSRIAMIAKRLMPAMQKAEKQRLEKVRQRMTTNNPKKAIAPMNESIDILFEEYIEEVAVERARPRDRVSDRVAAQDKAKREQENKLAPTDPIAVKSGGGKVEIIQYKQLKDTHTVLSGTKQSPKKVTDANKYAKMDGFVCGKTYQANFGACPDEVKKGDGKKGAKKEDGKGAAEGEAPEVNPEVQQATDANTVATSNLNTEKSKQELEAIKKEKEARDSEAEAQMAEVEAKQYSNNIGKVLGVPTQQPKSGTKLISKSNGQFEDWHKAVDMEAAVVAVANGCIAKRTEKSMKACLAQSGIAEADMIKLASSPTLIPSAMRMMDRVSLQLPEGMEWSHTGTGMGDIRISDTYYSAGASDKTPKTDLIARNPRTGETLNLSMKIGPGQLMSGQKGEASATMDVVLNRLRGCKGSPPTDCTQKLGKGNKQLLNKLEGVKNQIKEQFEKGQLGRGMGPTSWWLTGQIGGQKPSWWDQSGPGGMGLKYEDAVGQDPKDLRSQGFFPGFTDKEEKKLQTANKSHKKIAESIRDIFSSGEFGEEIKQNIMYEAMTGCGKFCPDCCGVDVCKGCQEAAAATHMIVGNKDGTGGTIKEIGLPGSDFMKKMSGATSVDIRFKTGQPKKSVRSWIGEMADNLVTKLPGSRGTDEGGRLNKQEEKQLTDVLSYAGIELKPGEWNKMTLKKKKQILSKSKKMGGYNFNSVMGLGSDFALGGPVQTFLEFNGDVQEEGGSFQDAMNYIGDDPARLLEFMGYGIEIDTPHEDLADTFSEEDSGKTTNITIDGETKEIPIMKDFEYTDYQQDYENTGEHIQDMNEAFRLLTEPDIVDRLVTQLKDKGMDNDKAHAVARSQLQKHGVLKKGTDDLTAHGEERNSMGAAGRAKDRAAQRSGRSVSDYNYNPRTNTATLKEDDCGCMNESVELNECWDTHVQQGYKMKGGKRVPNCVPKESVSESRLRSDVYALVNKKGKVTHANLTKKNAHKEVGNQGNKHTILLDPDAKQGDDRPKYAFKESNTQGVGCFSSSDIREGDMVGLYYLNLLEESPRYQRTDFCRLTNHSHHNQNISLINMEGSIYAFANKDIQEGEEILVDYFHVFDTVLPLLEEDGKIIDEVLRWTAGYEDMVIGEDAGHSLTDELAFFIEMGDCPKHIKQTPFYEKVILPLGSQTPLNPTTTLKEDEDPVNRAKRLKAYNAQPEQRARRSARTNERNKRIRKGQLSVGDGKDIDHRDGNPKNNSPSNISITSQKFNRGRNNNKGRTNEEHGAGEMGTKELLKKYLKDTPHMTIDDKFIKEMS